MRRFRRSTIVTAVLVLLAVTGTALALFFVLRGVTGKVTVGQMDVLYEDASAATIEGTCTVTHWGGASGTIDIQWDLAFPGETCTIRVDMTNYAFSNTAVVLDAFVMNHPSLEANLNGDGQDDCYKVLAAGQTGKVTVKFTVPTGAIPGSQWIIGADSGFRWVPQGQETPGCE